MLKVNSGQENQSPPKPKGKMSNFRKVLLATAIPPVVLSIVAGGLAVVGNLDTDIL